jgi:hypothetical protein
MSDTDDLTDLQILACTLIGESENLGENGMSGTALTIMNRAAANIKWMGGSSARGVCLQPEQYDCWDPDPGNTDRQRIISIATTNPLYAPYALATRIASDAIAHRLTDFTNNAVSYYDSDQCSCPKTLVGKTPCYIDGARYYFDLKAVK